MKSKSPRPLVPAPPSEGDIRDYAYHLYERSNFETGHDLDHWFEASAFLSANGAPQRHGVHHSPAIIADPTPSQLSTDF